MDNNFRFSEPLVSIIMTCYNNCDSLKDAISSIINQSYQNWELIFIDDGSTDQSLKVANQVLDKRIKIFSLDKNYGRGVSYQEGLNKATGKYIMFLDSDDWWYTNKIAKQIQYLNKNHMIMFVGSGLITSKNYIPIGVRANKKLSNITNKKITDPLIAFATICIRDTIISKYSFDKNLKVAQDSDFLRTLCMNERYSNIEDILYVYNESSNFNWLKMKHALKNTKIGLAKYKRNYFWAYFWNVATINFKILIYFFLFLFRIEKILLLNRVSIPSSQNVKLFYKEKNLMLKVKSKIFKNC